MIFGGNAFVDLIGEISLMKDLTATMDITAEEAEEEELAESTAEKLNVHDGKETSAQATSSSVPPRRPVGQQAIMDTSEEEARMEAAGFSPEEKDLRKKEKKKGGLTKEQHEKLTQHEIERRKAREERVDTLTKKLVDRISVWTETDKGRDVTHAFEEKIRHEVENLKMESFGIEILHAIGATYIQKATSFLKSQKFLGISGFFSRIKDKGTLAKETWGTISTAIDAQVTMEEMAKLEEKGGEEWTDEKKVEYSRRVTGKILAAAWRGSKYEIQGVLRDVCDKVLGDKSVSLEKRIERAHALMLVGNIYHRVSLSLFLRQHTSNSSRPNAIPRRRVTTWPLRPSWPKACLRRARMRRRKRTRGSMNVARRQDRDQHSVFHSLVSCTVYIIIIIMIIFFFFWGGSFQQWR